MKISRHNFAAGLLIALLCVSAASGQQQPSQQPSQQTQDPSAAPIPAYHSPLASGADQGDNGAESDKVAPDNRPPAGAQNLSLGAPEVSRSYWQSHVSLSETADSNALGGQSGWTSYTSIAGGLDVHKISGHSDLTVGYTGGGTISNDGNIGNSVVQAMSFAEKISVRRVTISFLDSLDYLPETAFGYGGIGGIGGIAFPGGGAVALQPGLSPDGTILTTRGQRIDNSFVTQADMILTPRSSFTLVGGYSLLDYFDNSFLNVSNVIAQGGYNHQINRTDTISVLYRFGQYTYSGNTQTVNDNVAQISYARRLTGRLAFQVSGGPDYTSFSTPIFEGNTGAATENSRLSWSLSSALTYQLRRGALGLTYAHGIGGGSGVFLGSITDTVSGNASRQLSRTLSGGISGGYSRNSALAIAGGSNQGQSYNYWFGGANISRPWGRTLSLFLSYQAQYQNSNVGFCAGITCSTSVVRHLISAGFNWSTRPMLF